LASGDTLTIYDGADTLSEIFTRLTKTNNDRAFLFNSSNPEGCLTFKFRSHTGSVEKRPGWEAAFLCFIKSTEPRISTSDLSFSEVTESSVKVDFKKGDGEKRLVILKKDSPVNVVPVDGRIFYDIDGNTVVYTGTESTIPITNLEADANYYFSIFEFNGSWESINYKQSEPAIGLMRTLPWKPLSVDEGVTDPKHLTIFPDPAEEWLTIAYKSNKGIYNKTLSTEIITGMGAIIMSREFEREADGFEVSLDVRALAKGFYFVKVGDGGKIYFRRFIKK
jgi:hypothetical protein